jgi:hypothetical protein
MNTPSLWVGLVSWNNCRDVVACLHQLHQQTYPHTHIIVVDNGSTDGTPSAVRTTFAHVHVVALARNYGFARGVNVLLRHVQQQGGDYVLLLNADTTFEPMFLEELVAAAEAQPHVGIFSPKIYLQGQAGRLWAIGGVLSRGKIQLYGLNRVDRGQYDTVMLDFVMGCAMLIRTRVLHHTGLMDGRFFVFYEEMDLCLRAKAAGWHIALLPHIHMQHEGGATTAARLHVRQFYLARSRMLFLRKYRASFNLLLLALYELALTSKIVGIHLLRREFRAGLAYVRGAATGLTRSGRAVRAVYETA